MSKAMTLLALLEWFPAHPGLERHHEVTRAELDAELALSFVTDNGVDTMSHTT